MTCGARNNTLLHILTMPANASWLTLQKKKQKKNSKSKEEASKSSPFSDLVVDFPVVLNRDAIIVQCVLRLVTKVT